MTFYLTKEQLEFFIESIKELEREMDSIYQEQMDKIDHQKFYLTINDLKKRISNKKGQLENIQVIEKDPNVINVGASVLTQIDYGDKVCIESFYIVIDDPDLSERRISIESPIGKALNGKRINDEIKVKVGKNCYLGKVLDVEYVNKDYFSKKLSKK